VVKTVVTVPLGQIELRFSPKSEGSAKRLRYNNVMPGENLAKNKYVQQSLFSKERPKRRSPKRKKEIAQMLANIKEKSGCVDCGGKFPYYLLDFDHVRGTKVSSISRMLDKHPLEDIFKEIDKCEIVCANCHRNRTFHRKHNRQF
jgi:hypothetical protein